jgi:hypothetical protein
MAERSQPVRHTKPAVRAATKGLQASETRRNRRDRDQERHRVMTQVRHEIDVIEAWVKAHALLEPDEKQEAWSRAEGDLERAYARFSQSLDVSRGVEDRVTFAEIMHVLLFMRPLHGRPAQTARIFYYFSLLWVAGWFIAIPIVVAYQPDGVGGLVGGLAVWVVFSVIVALGFYMLALHLDRDARPR